jgi:hypothetical protein
MLPSVFNEKSQTVLSSMRDYLLESGLQNSANAFDKALGEVVSYEIDGIYRNLFSKKVNRYLCEALLHINTDTRSTKAQKALMRGLIESYRGIYNLSTDDFGFEYNLEN